MFGTRAVCVLREGCDKPKQPEAHVVCRWCLAVLQPLERSRNIDLSRAALEEAAIKTSGRGQLVTTAETRKTIRLRAHRTVSGRVGEASTLSLALVACRGRVWLQRKRDMTTGASASEDRPGEEMVERR